jgi:hypothetical protein
MPTLPRTEGVVDRLHLRTQLAARLSKQNLQNAFSFNEGIMKIPGYEPNGAIIEKPYLQLSIMNLSLKDGLLICK